MNLLTSVNAEALLARMAGSEARLRASLRRVIERRSISVQAGVKADKLSGQVLHVRTGTLRRSINRRVTESGNEISATVGTNVVYARAHEYGFDGLVAVSPHLRRSVLQMSVKRSKRAKIGTGDIKVTGHFRHMVLPASSFLRSELREQAAGIEQDLRTAAVEALQP